MSTGAARRRVWILDAHFQIFRAYHALPDLRAPDSTPIGALRGYAQTLIKFLREQRPSHVAAAFDFALTSFRNDLYADYKLGRTEAPEDLEPQFELCARVTDALGIRRYERQGFEADDVIASLVRQVVPQGADVSIVTRDKDLAALVSEHVGLYDLAKGEHTGPAQVKERLGVAPERVPDLLALVGDAVDNVPGVRGIGATTAARLIAAFGPVDRIPADADAIAAAGVRGAARVAHALALGYESLGLSRRLVALRDDVALEARLEDLAWRGADSAALSALLEPLGLGSLLARVPAPAPPVG
jgi:DNA polymerase-1